MTLLLRVIISETEYLPECQGNRKVLLFLSDLITINLAWAVYYYIRVESGWIFYANPPEFLAPQ